MAIDLQCVDIDIDMLSLFSADELYNLWRGYNIRRYLNYGPSKEWGDPIVADAKPLLADIIEKADMAAAGGLGYAATLRFGHDINVIPLAALLELEGTTFRSDDYDEGMRAVGRLTAYRPWRPTYSLYSSATARAKCS